MIVLDVNTNASKELTRQLTEISRSAFPVAVRGALNNAAFDMKQNTMPRSAKDAFAERSPNFFKATSTVDMARGFDVESMEARIGFDKGKAKSAGNDEAVRELEQQEEGGSIAGRSFVPIDTARTGGSNKKMVRPNARLRKMKFVNAKNAPGKTDGQKFIKSVAFAGVGGMVLGTYKGRQIIWRVNSLKRTGEGKMKLTPLYTYEKNRAVKIDKPAHFMRKATEVTTKKLPDYYAAQAQKQFEKYLK